MSEINEPKEPLPDDDIGYIAEELYEKTDLDTELFDNEVDELDMEELYITTNYANYINMEQVNADLLATASTGTYKPAQIIRVLSKTPRALSSGEIVIDYELEIEGVVGATSYEVRVSDQ